MTRQHQPSPARRGPFSRPLRMREIPEVGLVTSIEASAEECAAIAADAGIEGIRALRARFRIDRRAGGRLDVTGTLDATITQVCVVTLEPFESMLDPQIAIAFAPDASEQRPDGRETRQRRQDIDQARDREITVAGNDDQVDPPDSIVDDRIDLGTVAIEFLVLSLDPHPKKPGVHFNDVLVGEDEEAEPSPFAALARLKDSP